MFTSVMNLDVVSPVNATSGTTTQDVNLCNHTQVEMEVQDIVVHDHGIMALFATN